MTPPPTAFHGWRVVAAAFVIAVFGWGLGFYGPPVFLQAVREARGWPIWLVSAAVTLHFLAGALAVANLPWLHRRFGLPGVTIAGAALLALGLLGWAIAAAPWQLFLATLFSGAGWVALGAAGINAMVSPWFVRRRPAALATAYNGASIGGVVFSPLWVLLIGGLGFPAAASLVGVAMLLVVAGLALLVLRDTPESLGQVPDGEAPSPAAMAATMQPAPLGKPWRDRAFVTLAIGMALSLFAQIGLIAHLFSLLAPAMGGELAGIAAGLATAAAILGRTLVGWLLPPGADRRLAAMVNLGVQMLGCAALLLAAGTSLPWLFLGVLMLGLGIGNATSLPPLIAQQEFSRADVARVVALVTATAQAGYAFAPLVFGLLRDLGGEGVATPAVFCLAALVQLAAAGFFFAGWRAFRRRLPESTAA